MMKLQMVTVVEGRQSRAEEKSQPMVVAAEEGRPGTEGVLAVEPSVHFSIAIAVSWAATAAASPSIARAWIQ
jgi:hypothetical protein